MHETTETSNANMRYPKSLIPSRTVAKGGIGLRSLIDRWVEGLTLDHAPQILLGRHAHPAIYSAFVGLSCIGSSGVGVLRKRGGVDMRDRIDTLMLGLSGFYTK